MRFSKLVLPGIAMIAVTYGLGRFSFGLLLPGISESLQLSESTSGIISSLLYLSYCFTIVVSTVLTTREGPKIMIISAGLSVLAGLILMSIAPNAWVLALGVLLAGASTGLISPPYGAAISLWMKEDQQGKANTWINSGTSFGIVFAGVGAIILATNWRLTYLIYAVLALLVLLWNVRAIPKEDQSSKLMFEQGELSIRGIKGATPLVLASLIFGMSTAAFWTFSRSFIEVSGNFSEWELSLFWIMIGLFGVLGGFSGFFIEKGGLSLSYRLGSLLVASASIILAFSSESLFMAYLSASIFGSSYIFLSGVFLVWGIRVFITNASLGIGVPFLLLAVGQVIGQLLAGIFVGTWGYAATFIIYGVFGMLAVLLGPAKSREKNVES
jgi:predicted MFS family arabinose efflux permease